MSKQENEVVQQTRPAITVVGQTPIEVVLGIGEEGKTTAKKLYEFLEMDKSQYARWCKSNILENPFAIENEDFEVLDINVENPKGGRPTQDFKLSANFAKKLSMQGKTERAEQARDYFIAVEGKLKEMAAEARKAKIDKLTITSRELTILAKERRALHSDIMFRIRECITELQEMGLNPDDYFIKSEYLGGNNEMRPQYLVTEQGCEYYASRITLNRRNNYRSEYMLRFDQLRALAEGKPFDRKLPKLICLADVEEKEPQIQLYRTDSGGIVLLDGGIYSLTPEEIEALSRFIPEMQKCNIGQIQYAVSAFLKSMKKSSKLEKIASWGMGKEEEPKKENALLLPKKMEPDLNQVENLSVKQAQQRYGIGKAKVVEVSELAGAVIRCGTKVLYSRQVLDEYFKRHTE